MRFDIPFNFYHITRAQKYVETEFSKSYLSLYMSNKNQKEITGKSNKNWKPF